MDVDFSKQKAQITAEKKCVDKVKLMNSFRHVQVQVREPVRVQKKRVSCT